MASNYTCDICGKFTSSNLNEFTMITIEKYPADPITLFLCEQKCFKLFRKFWKDQDKLENFK